MGIIKKLNELELVGGKQDRDVYPVTSTKAVFDENNKSLDKILKDIEAGGGGGGDIPLQSRTVIAFTHGELDGSTPPIPNGGSWDIITNEIILPSGWTTTDTLEPPVWMSSGEFLATDPTNPTWTPPVRVSGTNGTDGTDGSSIEFIFFRTVNDLKDPPIPANNPDQTNYVPEGGWTDSPQGITIEFQAEWVWTRTKKSDGKWNNWSDKALWSKWGVNGKDGDGVEYIFFRNNGAPVDNPTPRLTRDLDYNIDTDEYQERGDFEGKEYIPLGWLDNPPSTGINPNEKYVWVSIRKRRKGPKNPDGTPIDKYKDRIMWGTFSDPAIWAKYGEDGYNGISLRTMYQKALAGEGTAPTVVKDNINPGSKWQLVFPIDYNKETDIVWQIQAYVTFDNKLAEVTVNGEKVKGWQGPWVCSGVNGTNGEPLDYKTYAYKKFDGSVPPDPPSIRIKPNALDKGWEDYPTSSDGNWWQVIGNVLGQSGLVSSWGKVIPLNGKDGKAQDGKWTELRFKVSTFDIISLSPSQEIARDPGDGWELKPPVKNDNQNMFMITAIVNPDGQSISGKWSEPVKINGERGPRGFTGATGERGPSGKNGIDGLPGISYAVQYAKGTENSYVNTWTNDIPNTSEEYPYIWCKQGKDNNGIISYGTPFRLQGTQGLPGKDGRPGTDGKQGKSGPVVYPAGIYNPTTKYVSNGYKSPYVFDPLFGEFYVYNNSESPWLGTDKKVSPGQSFTTDPYKFWSKFDSFEALYTKVGIIANGLIGSSVFNGDYMFSQLGIYNNPLMLVPNREKVLYKVAKEKPIFDNTSVSPSGWSSVRPNISSLLDGEIIFYIRGVFSATRSGNFSVAYTTLIGTWTEPIPVSSYNYRTSLIFNSSGSLSKPSTSSVLPSGWSETPPSNVLSNMDRVSFTRGKIVWDEVTQREKVESWDNPKLLTDIDNLSSNYEMFDPKDPYGKNSPWYPNVCINFRTGEAWFAAGEVYFDEFGHAKFKGDLKSGNTVFGDVNGNHIEVKPDENGETAIEFISKNKKKPLKLRFKNNGEGELFLVDQNSKREVKINSDSVKLSYDTNGSPSYSFVELEAPQGNAYNRGGLRLGGTACIHDLKVLVHDLKDGGGSYVSVSSGLIINTGGDSSISLNSNKSNTGAIIYVRGIRGKGRITLFAPIRTSRGDETQNLYISDTVPRMLIFDGTRWNEYWCE